MQGKQPYGNSNLVVMLKGLNIPVSINVVMGQTSYDYLDYLRIDRLIGSNNPKTPVTLGPSAKILLKLISGVPPKGSQKMEVSGGDAQVWEYKNDYLLLTKGTLSSPNWNEYQSSGDYHVYAFQETPVVYLYGESGALDKLTISAGGSSHD